MAVLTLTTAIRFTLLFSLVIGELKAKSLGLKLSLEQESFHNRSDSPCSQLTCLASGRAVTLESLIISKVKVNETLSQILAVTKNKPEIDTSFDKIRGKGTLQDNVAAMRVELWETDGCTSHYFTCVATFTSESGHKGEAFTVAGPGKLPNCRSSPQPARQSQAQETVTVSQPKAPLYTSENPYVSELWFLGDKITKVEGKFETLSDRLERRLTQNMESVQRRAGTLENSVLERVTSTETDFSSRVSRLEDRVSSLLLTQSPDPSSDVDQTLANMERRLEGVERMLGQINGSTVTTPDQLSRLDQTVVCDRGMGDEVTKQYPTYVIMTHKGLVRDILCDTHTDGGGWIVFQRRVTGTVDFYKDWTSYKDGFGSLSGDFWLGNEAIHQLTDKHPYELRVVIRNAGQEYFADYSSFALQNESSMYKLLIGSYTGTAGDGMAHHKNAKFSTFDRDHDTWSDGNDAILYHAGWWYPHGWHANLNGIWGRKDSKGIGWHNGKSTSYPYYSEMKIRRVGPNTSR